MILLCSGDLGLVILKRIHLSEQLIFVFTDRNSDEIINYCKENSIAFYAGNPRLQPAKTVIRELECDVLLSINYLFIVEQDLLNTSRKYAINLHGSLLPKYRGRTPHVWAIINGEKETGITAHLMTTEVDNGSILKQLRIEIRESDTGYSILQKFNEYYPEIVESILNDIKEGKVEVKGMDFSKATYFGKRTPNDGLINWNWQKERIKNWVRAQAEPYPGAYTFYKGHRIVINEIEFSEVGFDYSDENGKILKNNPDIIVKTPNGAVKLVNFKPADIVEFKTGNIFV